MPKPITDIATISNPQNPWIQSSDPQIFSLKLNKPLSTLRLFAKNPRTEQLQQLTLVPDLIGKRKRGEPLAEDSFGISDDGLTLYWYSTDTALTLSVTDFGYEEILSSFGSNPLEQESWIAGIHSNFGEAWYNNYTASVATENAQTTLTFKNGRKLTQAIVDGPFILGYDDVDKLARSTGKSEVIGAGQSYLFNNGAKFEVAQDFNSFTFYRSNGEIFFNTARDFNEVKAHPVLGIASFRQDNRYYITTFDKDNFTGNTEITQAAYEVF